MKCLTLWEPYATLIALGVKTIETRSWVTSYRGDLAIHAARKWDKSILVDCRRAMNALASRNWQGPPLNFARFQRSLGCIVAVAHLDRCERSEGPEIYSELNQLFGDLALGRGAWILTDVRPLAEPVPLKGQRGLCGLPRDVETLVRQQLEAAHV